MTEPSDSVLRDWLLHRLPDKQVDGLEQRLMLGDDMVARVQDAEHDLIDDYARGRLDARDRADVEHWLLRTPLDRHNLNVSRALAQATAQRRTQSVEGIDTKGPTALARSAQPRRPGSRARRSWYGAAGGALAASVLFVTVFSWRSQHEGSVEQGLSLRHSTRTVIANVTLLANTQRGATATPAVAIPSNADAVRLQVEVAQPQAQAVYTLSVSDSGKTWLVARNLALHQSGPYAFVEAVVPARTLESGPSQITLTRQGDPAPPTQWTVRIKRSN